MEFLWHDYETFGTVPNIDRPCQFAALRTDSDLNPVGEPIEMYCAPADDVLPRPGACLVTGITPQLAKREGRIEAEFATTIHREMSKPGTCSAGYNSIRFDDEVSRNLFYRNLMDPYEREWKNGNSRWDLINLTRMCYALRPDGIEWPTAASKDDAATPRPSFRLEDLTEANGIGHMEAHDALADVNATLDLARLILKAQPRLFYWALGMRDKNQARKLLDIDSGEPVIHTSGRISSSRGCTTLVLPIARHPKNDKAVIVFDLMGDAEALLECDANDIRDRVFTPSLDMPDGVERLPLKAVKWNAVPMLAPAAVLQGVDQDRIGLDSSRCMQQAKLLNAHIDRLGKSVSEAFQTEFQEGETDPDLAIYGGGFFDDFDRQQMRQIHQTKPEKLGEEDWVFHDVRLPKMLLRFRARNWPETLSQSDWQAWQQDRRQRLNQPPDGKFYGLEEFKSDLAEARNQHKDCARKLGILDELEAWSINLGLEV